MSIKTTLFLSRYQAETRYLELKQEVAEAKARKKVKFFSDDELGDELDKLENKMYDLDGSYGFNNYLVDVEEN